MRKLWVLLSLCFFLTGCVNISAPDAVKEYLEKIRNHEQSVVSSLEEKNEKEEWTDAQAKLYNLIMKKQYVNLEYKIVHETYNGNTANIEVEIEVYDYHHSYNKALEYIQKHQSEFLGKDGTIDQNKYKNLQLEYMDKEKNRILYTISFDCVLNEDSWEIKEPTTVDIEKIKGIYKYESKE